MTSTPAADAAAHPREEVEAALTSYLDLRRRIEAGEATWVDLAELFTDDATYIDPAWGRVQGIGAITEFLEESMRGLEDWRFPVVAAAVDGDVVLVQWEQVLPGTRPDGGRWVQSGYTTLRYAGGGRFDFEEDVLNMAHVLEDLAASGWTPPEGFALPPRDPDRDVARPPRG